MERTNLRRYENGRYVGLSNREVRSFITPGLDGVYDGNFYVVEKTLRNQASTFAGIYDAIPAKFRLGTDGKMEMKEDNGYPTFRSFPSFPAEKIKPGDTWTSRAERSVDPLNQGVFTRLKIEVLYNFIGEEIYNGQAVYRIGAMWQTNYGMNWRDPNGDPDLKKARGGHKAEILVLKSTGAPLLIIDNVDESFEFAGGKNVQLKGKISLFVEFPPAIDRGTLIPALGEIASVSDSFSEALSLDSEGLGSGSASKEEIALASLDSSVPSGSESEKERIEQNLSVLEDVEKSRAELASFSPPASEKIGSDGNPLDGTNEGENGLGGNRENQSGLALGGENRGDKNGTSSESNNLESDKTTRRNEILSMLDSGIGSNGSSNESRNAQNENSSASSDSENQKSPKNDMVVEQTNAGIRLSVRNLRFKADSSELIAGESSRLDEIAHVLALVPGGKFLVEGHTARVGDITDEQALSEERAKVVAQELSRRGVSADSFICRGWGGSKPIAPNTNERGKAQNRRVEITILE